MIDFDAVDLSEYRSKEVMFLLTVSVEKLRYILLDLLLTDT